jgi:hypothetical protein
VLNEKFVAVTQKGVVVIEDGETFGEQQHVELEIYLWQQRNLVSTKNLCKHILPLKLQHFFL